MVGAQDGSPPARPRPPTGKDSAAVPTARGFVQGGSQQCPAGARSAFRFPGQLSFQQLHRQRDALQLFQSGGPSTDIKCQRGKVALAAMFLANKR